MMKPAESTITPDPITRSCATASVRPGAGTGPIPVTRTCTMLGETSWTNDSIALSSCTSGARRWAPSVTVAPPQQHSGQYAHARRGLHWMARSTLEAPVRRLRPRIASAHQRSSRSKKLHVHVLAHPDVVQQIPARVIRIHVDDELVARPAPGRGDRPIPVRNLEHAAWQPNAAGCKVKASDGVEVRRGDERELPRLEWVREVEARIVGRGVPIPVAVPNVRHRDGRSPGFGEWRRVAGPASDWLARDTRQRACAAFVPRLRGELDGLRHHEQGG